MKIIYRLLNWRRRVFWKIHEVFGDGYDVDEIPGTVGKFGLDVDNPVPVRPVVGIPTYLNDLTFPDGTKISYEKIATTYSLYVKDIIMAYGLYHENGSFVCMIFLANCYERDSRKKPDFQHLVHRYTEGTDADISLTRHFGNLA